MARTSKPKVTFGTMCTAKIRYVIAIVSTDNTLQYVTEVCFSPKECYWENGKKAEFFEDRKYAEDICFGLNANGTGAFVMEVPDYFNEDYFANPQRG